MDLPSEPEALRRLDEPGVARGLVIQARWPDGKIACPKCGCSKLYLLKRSKRWKCRDCARQFKATGGTVFQNSQLDVKIWLAALWFLVNAGEKELPTYPMLAKQLGTATTTIWYALHKLRLALAMTSSLEDPPLPISDEERFLRALSQVVRAPREEVERLMPLYRKSYAKRSVSPYGNSSAQSGCV